MQLKTKYKSSVYPRPKLKRNNTMKNMKFKCFFMTQNLIVWFLFNGNFSYFTRIYNYQLAE